MSLATMITTSVFVFSLVQRVLSVHSNAPGDKFCPVFHLNSGEPMDVGCFENYTNYVGTYHPELAEAINATFAFYWKSNASKPYREWRFDESFVNESKHLMNSKSHLAFIIHGFTDDSDSEWVSDMTEALLELDDPSKRHVITVDWRSGAEGPNYIQASMNVFMLGRLTADLIHRLMLKYRLNPDNIHLIGHSLGGQTVGQITEWLHLRFHTRVGRSTGLDVAAPGFEGLNVWPDKAHSKFLEVYHTSSGNNPVRGGLGLQDNFGHVDLYPNGGIVPQPGCPPPPLQIGCSHSVVKPIYIDLLRNCDSHCRYIGRSCVKVLDAVNANCTGPMLDICKRIEYLRHEATDESEEIIYMNTTNQDTPNRCSSTFDVEAPNFLTKIIGSILKALYRLFGLGYD